MKINNWGILPEHLRAKIEKVFRRYGTMPRGVKLVFEPQRLRGAE
jgi:hypothetical protein